jgi:hypothetical protein
VNTVRAATRSLDRVAMLMCRDSRRLITDDDRRTDPALDDVEQARTQLRRRVDDKEAADPHS